jgi:hypothetical protein
MVARSIARFCERKSTVVVIFHNTLGIPSRVMHALVGKTDPREINQIIRGEVELALREASEFDMQQITARNAAARQSAAEPASLSGGDED